MVISQGAFAVMVFTDRWFMSQIDSVHIAAAMGGGVASFFCLSLFIGLISYGNALVAQYYGAGMFPRCPRVVSQGVIIAVVSLPLLAIVGVGMGLAFDHMGHDPRQVPLERMYFYTLMGGGFFHLVKACLASYFVGIGRTRVVMAVDVIGICINIPLSWMLIFGQFGLPELGIVGAAAGTVFAQFATILLFLCFYLSRAHRQQFSVGESLAFDRGVMRRYLRLGVPSALESFMNTGTFNVFLLLFQGYGVVQGASMAIVFNWDMVSFVPMMGLNIGVMSLIGRFVGAGDMTRTNQVISSGLILALGYSGLLAVLYLMFRVELVDVFATGDQHFNEIRELASAMMIGLTTYMLADAVLLIAGGALRGAGDTRWVMWTSTSLHWLMLLAQYFVIVVWQLDPLVSWWVFVVMLQSIAVCYAVRLYRGRWRQPERLARVMQE
ncbi:MATE family efflux transporter [Seongchinamella sediminis]|uniref:Multidrug-efflux transporter n=2 Tax=Seongchinamella sediminis TaxID=2283635 RepID=A0A3L7E2Z9_9GAMM|nr:MATE family efflux transporter [Seongchinamella sediminis]